MNIPAIESAIITTEMSRNVRLLTFWRMKLPVKHPMVRKMK